VTSLTAVYVTGTGHVVGALALNGADASTDVATLVGRALPLRVFPGGGATASLPLPARSLGAVAAAGDAGALDDPLAYGVESAPDGTPRPALVRLAPWAGGLDLTGEGLTVTLPLAASRATPVVAFVSDEAETHVLTGGIPAGRTAVTLPVTLAPQSRHGLLVLATGWAGRLTGATVR
jgi:hypothetical protein